MTESIDQSFLQQAHLVVAGIRVFVHREGKTPSVEELADFLKTTPELIHHATNRLEKEEVLRPIRTSFETKLYIRDLSKLRDLPEEVIPDLDEEIKKKRAERKTDQVKLEAMFSAETIKLRQAKKLAALEKKMRKDLHGRRKPWAD